MAVPTIFPGVYVRSEELTLPDLSDLFSAEVFDFQHRSCSFTLRIYLILRLCATALHYRYPGLC